MKNDFNEIFTKIKLQLLFNRHENEYVNKISTYLYLNIMLFNRFNYYKCAFVNYRIIIIK